MAWNNWKASVTFLDVGRLKNKTVFLNRWHSPKLGFQHNFLCNKHLAIHQLINKCHHRKLTNFIACGQVWGVLSLAFFLYLCNFFHLIPEGTTSEMIFLSVFWTISWKGTMYDKYSIIDMFALCDIRISSLYFTKHIDSLRILKCHTIRKKKCFFIIFQMKFF